MKFWPTFWCVESRAQTVFASILRSQIMPNINYRRFVLINYFLVLIRIKFLFFCREILTLNDSGEVALDWLESNCADDSPIILILPGLTGW